MPKVIDIEQESRTFETINDVFSWKVDIPEEVKKENNLSENSYLVLTVHDGKINGELINPTAEIRKEVDRILGKYAKTFEEMKRIGD